MAKQPRSKKENNQASKQQEDKEKTTIHASVESSLFSFAIGQINIRVSRQSYKQRLLERNVPGSCRHRVGLLLRHIPARDLYLAFERLALQCDGQQGRVLRKNAVLDQAFGGFFIAVLIMLLLLFCPPLLLSGHPEMKLQGYGASAVILGIGWIALDYFVWPQHTAKKAMRVLAEAANQPRVAGSSTHD